MAPLEPSARPPAVSGRKVVWALIAVVMAVAMLGGLAGWLLVRAARS